MLSYVLERKIRVVHTGSYADFITSTRVLVFLRKRFNSQKPSHVLVFLRKRFTSQKPSQAAMRCCADDETTLSPLISKYLKSNELVT